MGDQVANTAGYFAGAVALLGTLWKILMDRGRRSDPALHYGYACGALIGAGMAVSAPATAPALAAVVPDPVHLTLVADQLKVAASGALAMMAYSTRPAAAARRAVRRQTALTAATVLLSIAAFVAASPVREGEVVGVSGADRPILAAYVALFAVHTAWCLAVFGFLIGRCARCLPPGVLRLGLRLMALSALAGLLWTADNLDDLADILTTGRENGAESRVSGVAGAVCVTLGFAGATASAWADWARHMRAWHDHRRLGPLWSAMRAALPEIELVTPAGPLGAGRRRRRRDVQFALYRRIIEIRDGQLSLRPHLHPAVPLWVREFIGPAEAEELAAVVEAAALAAALEAARAGHRFPFGPGTGCVPHPVAAGIHEEAAWLVKVAAAYTGSPAVAHVRDRVRAELGRAAVQR
ncbi:MAB_1171c family putative transporter [Kitasatospora sp. NBC_00039]|uniref:MAB_1171c family putative transporter n=1 Tax=Kitasatospora sp. NBC_00039 TaxID=2903565 RepID=UPI00324544B7